MCHLLWIKCPNRADNLVRRKKNAREGFLVLFFRPRSEVLPIPKLNIFEVETRELLLVDF